MMMDADGRPVGGWGSPLPLDAENRWLRWTDAVSADDLYHRIQGGMAESDRESADLQDELEQMQRHWDDVREQLEVAESLLRDAGIGFTELETTESRRAAMKSAVDKAVKSHDLDVLAETLMREFERAELILARLVACRADWARLSDEVWRLQHAETTT